MGISATQWLIKQYQFGATSLQQIKGNIAGGGGRSINLGDLPTSVERLMGRLDEAEASNEKWLNYAVDRQVNNSSLVVEKMIWKWKNNEYKLRIYCLSFSPPSPSPSDIPPCGDAK